MNWVHGSRWCLGLLLLVGCSASGSGAGAADDGVTGSDGADTLVPSEGDDATKNDSVSGADASSAAVDSGLADSDSGDVGTGADDAVPPPPDSDDSDLNGADGLVRSDGFTEPDGSAADSFEDAMDGIVDALDPTLPPPVQCAPGASHCDRWVLDSQGRIIYQAEDPGCLGVHRACKRTKYGASSGESSSFLDPDCDGIPDAQCIGQIPNGPPGHILIRFDQNCDGTPSTCKVIVQDAAGKLLFSGFDTDCDTVADEGCKSAEYPPYDEASGIAYDFDCDGTYDSNCEYKRVGPDGAFLASHVDEDCDGTPDTLCHQSLETGDPQIGRIGKDADCDGEFEQCGVTFYSANGHQVGSHVEASCDGVPTSDCFSRQVDEDGKVLGQSTDADCDGVADKNCSQYEFDADGNQILLVGDVDCDGENKKCSSWTYTFYPYGYRLDSVSAAPCDGGDGGLASPPDCFGTVFDLEGRVIAEWEDADCDGTPDTKCREYAYSATGHPLDATYDANCDGTPDWCRLVTVEAE